MRLTAIVFVAAGLAVSAQQPQIQNGTVETRKATSLDRDIAAISAASSDITWIGWRETAVRLANLAGRSGSDLRAVDDDPPWRTVPA